MALVDLILRLQKGEPLTNQEMDNNLSNLLAGIVQSSCDWAGPLEPEETFPYLRWIDTSTNPPTNKIRNAEDDGWITLGSATTPLGAAANLGIAATEEAQALTADDVVITPKKLAAAFGGVNQNLTANGYQKLPGGLIIQWGLIHSTDNASGTITFPIAFPNACLFVTAHNYASSAADNVIVKFNIPEKASAEWFSQSYELQPASAGYWGWFAVGN